MISDDPATKKLFRQQDAAKAMTEHTIEQKRFGDNRERLKGERLAREATAHANKEAAPTKSKKKSASKKRSAPVGKGPTRK